MNEENSGSRRWGTIAKIGLVLAVALELFVLLRGGSGGDAAPETAGSRGEPVLVTQGDTAVAYAACARLVASELRGAGTAYFPVADLDPEVSEGSADGDDLAFRFRSRTRLQLESGDALWHAFDCTVERTDDGWRRRELRVRRLRGGAES